jgi:hypothetical protein
MANLYRLLHDGFEWRWKAQRRVGLVLVRETTPGKLPAFIESLLPERWVAQLLHLDERDGRERLCGVADAICLTASLSRPARNWRHCLPMC